MSHPELSCTSSDATEKPCVNESTEDCEADSAGTNTKHVGTDGRASDSSVRDRVLKEVGFTSTAFIGPAFPPQTTAAESVIEDSLSEFYRELEKIDTPDGANGNLGKQDAAFDQPLVSPKLPASKETQDVPEGRIVNTRDLSETDGSQKSSGRKQSAWPHWYQNEPYSPMRQRPALELSSAQWHYPQPRDRPPNLRFHRPPFPHQPPPYAFPNQQKTPPHVSPTFQHPGTANHYQEELHFPPFSHLPPPNVCRQPSQGFYGAPPHQFDRDEGRSYDGHSDNVDVRWPRDRNHELSQFNEDYDRLQRYDSENEPWEQQHHYQPRDDTHAYHSALVLILMRGLPGSGKSTLARELLSTGPSGIILSTDDYFAHKNGYHYDPSLLGAAHEWNQIRARDALHDGLSPIIIDNTNIQAWEMKPYVQMALERGYKVDFREPDTRWKFDPYELEKRNKHGVPQEKIAQMMDRFSFPISVDIVMNSQEPSHVNQRRRPGQPQMMRRKQNFH